MIQPLKPLPPLAGPGAAAGASTPAAPGFGQMVTHAIDNLNHLQLDAAQAGQALADGTSQNVAHVMVTAEKAGLALELASQLRNKAVAAYQQLMNMQV